MEDAKKDGMEPIDMSKVSESFKAYIEAKEALFARYGKGLPELKKAA